MGGRAGQLLDPGKEASHCVARPCVAPREEGGGVGGGQGLEEDEHHRRRDRADERALDQRFEIIDRIGAGSEIVEQHDDPHAGERDEAVQDQSKAQIPERKLEHHADHRRLEQDAAEDGGGLG